MTPCLLAFSARTKSLLSKFLYLHVFLALVLLAKLCPNILDRMDIFVLALEELNVPKVNNCFESYGMVSFKIF